MQQRAGVKAYYCDHFELPVARGSRFPVEKYARLRQRLALTAELALTFVESPAIGEAELALAHDPRYVEQVLAGTLPPEQVRVLGFPWSPALVARALRSAGGTLAACESALTDVVAVNLAGGTHHAGHASGAGYCVFNDVAIAALALRKAGRLERLLIVDADVHQGDGTASILAESPALYTFSIHGEHNFPRRKATSDLDLALPDGVGDAAYLAQFQDGLERALLAARPQLVIYLAGADPYEADRLGRLAVSKQGLAARDELLFAACRLRHLPVAVVMGGGYAPDVEDIVDIHAATVMLAAAHYRSQAVLRRS